MNQNTMLSLVTHEIVDELARTNMASVNIDVDSAVQQNRTNDSLTFQDIPHDGEISDTNATMHTFKDFPDTMASDDDDKSELLVGEKSRPYWTFEYYQQFFDVETKTVLKRILASMIPHPRKNFLKTKIRPNPDLYGPFWVCTTLVFSIAIVGNLVTIFNPDKTYAYSFNKVTYAATAIYGYWWLIPSCLFVLLWWRGNLINYTFLEIICIYGYSLSIYIPLSFLWMIPVNIVRWSLASVGAVLSGSVLLLSFLPLLREESRKVAITILVLIFVFHAALASGFVLYFFHVPEPVDIATNTTSVVLTTTLPT